MQHYHDGASRLSWWAFVISQFGHHYRDIVTAMVTRTYNDGNYNHHFDYITPKLGLVAAAVAMTRLV